MKKTLIFNCMVAVFILFTGCDQTGDNGYQGTNYIYLEAVDGKTTLVGEDDEITVDVHLTTSLAQDITLDFVVEGMENVLAVTGSQLTIPAGSKKASLKIAVADADGLPEVTHFKLGLADETVLPEKLRLDSEFSFALVVIEVPDLTEVQLESVATYLAATGINISRYLGEVTVNVEYVGFDNTNQRPLDPVEFTGTTVIALSEETTSSLPVLKMMVNPMGIQDKMYEVLRSMTVENSDWCDAENYPDNTGLMNAIGWNATSQETYTMSLDGIRLNQDKTVDFLGTGVDQYGYEIVIVPFEYSFSAYDREVEAIADGTFEKEEQYAFECTANPAYHMNNTTIAFDDCDYGHYREASAEISEEALVFTFCVYMCTNDYDYTRIVATYTPNN